MRNVPFLSEIKEAPKVPHQPDVEVGPRTPWPRPIINVLLTIFASEVFQVFHKG